MYPLNQKWRLFQSWLRHVADIVKIYDRHRTFTDLHFVHQDRANIRQVIDARSHSKLKHDHFLDPGAAPVSIAFIKCDFVTVLSVPDFVAIASHLCKWRLINRKFGQQKNFDGCHKSN